MTNSDGGNAPRQTLVERLREIWRTRRPLVIGALAAIVSLVVVVIAVPVSLNSGKRLQGTFSLFDSDGEVAGEWNDCSGTGGYDDFAEGASVTVRDQDGVIIGSGRTQNINERIFRAIVEASIENDLTWGEPGDNPDEAFKDQLDTLKGLNNVACVLYFDVMVRPADFMSVEISDRGELTFSRDELEETDWWIGASLGS